MSLVGTVVDELRVLFPSFRLATVCRTSVAMFMHLRDTLHRKLASGRCTTPTIDNETFKLGSQAAEKFASASALRHELQFGTRRVCRRPDLHTVLLAAMS